LRRYASAGNSDRNVSVRLSVRPTVTAAHYGDAGRQSITQCRTLTDVTSGPAVMICSPHPPPLL